MTDVPIAIKQAAEALRNERTPQRIRFNYEQVLRETRDFCDRELKRK